MDNLDRDCIILYWVGFITCLTIGIVLCLGRAGVISKTVVRLFLRTYIVLTVVTFILVACTEALVGTTSFYLILARDYLHFTSSSPIKESDLQSEGFIKQFF